MFVTSDSGDGSAAFARSHEGKAGSRKVSDAQDHSGNLSWQRCRGRPAEGTLSAREVVSALSGVPRAEILARRKKHSGRGTFDRGDLKEVAGGRYGATIDSLCNEAFAGALIALREGTATLQWDDTRPEDITPAVAVAEGHFVQVGLRPV